MIELAIIDFGETEEEEIQGMIEYNRSTCEFVYNNLLAKLNAMARIINNERPGKRKELMLDKYEQVDGELEKWKKTRSIIHMQYGLDKSNSNQ